MAFIGMVFAAGVILILMFINVIIVIELVIGVLLYMTKHKKSAMVLFILSGIPIVAALIAIVFFTYLCGHPIITLYEIIVIVLVIGILLYITKHKKSATVLFILSAIPTVAAIIATSFYIYSTRHPQYESDHGSVTLNKSWIDHEKKLLKEHNNEGITKLLNKHPDLIWYIDTNHVNLLEYGLYNCDVELMQIAYDRGLRFDDPKVYDHITDTCTLDRFYRHLGYPSSDENYHPGVTTDEIIETLRFAIEHGAQTEWEYSDTSSESIFLRTERWVHVDDILSEKDRELLIMLERINN